jgi:hypothetical protein
MYSMKPLIHWRPVANAFSASVLVTFIEVHLILMSWCVKIQYVIHDRMAGEIDHMYNQWWSMQSQSITWFWLIDSFASQASQFINLNSLPHFHLLCHSSRLHFTISSFCFSRLPFAICLLSLATSPQFAMTLCHCHFSFRHSDSLTFHLSPLPFAIHSFSMLPRIQWCTCNVIPKAIPGMKPISNEHRWSIQAYNVPGVLRHFVKLRTSTPGYIAERAYREELGPRWHDDVAYAQ